MTLTPDGTQLYVTNGNLNSIAVVALSGTDNGRPGGGSHSHRLVPELRELQPRWQMGIRGQWEVADGRESHLVLWRYGPPSIPSCMTIE